jgi:endonuclease YncB( thermonuclease family)
VAVVVGAVWMAGCGSNGGGAEPEPSEVATPSTGKVSDGEGGSWRSVRVVDGDTLEVSGPGGEMTVRVIGINTPESGECFGEEASEALGGLVSGAELVLVEDRSGVDQFGRALRYVETAEGVDIGAELVAGGFAIARRYPPDDARADRYADLQRDAQQAGRGLWASDACGASDLAGVEMVIDVNADAPGDDGLNLNDEWVRFTNAGTDPIDLDGWEVADESASNRYRFSDLRLAPGASVTLFSGCGPDDETSRFWCASGSAVWNNSGDTVFLRDAKGNIAVSYSYGDAG